MRALRFDLFEEKSSNFNFSLMLTSFEQLSLELMLSENTGVETKCLREISLFFREPYEMF